MCARPIATATTPMSAIRPMASGSRCHPDIGEGFMKIARAILLSLVLSLVASLPIAQKKPAPQDALFFLFWPKNGAVIKGGFWCRFGRRNMGVTHAGDSYPNAGPHHLFVDVNDPLNPNEPIPSDKSH